MSLNPTSHSVVLPNRPIVQANGDVVQGPLKLHYWEWKGHQPTILVCHGASYHGRCYDHIINEALHGFHVIALDFRGHGRSEKHPPPYHIRWLGEDVFYFIEILNLPKHNLIGIGHSMGGYAITYAAAIAPRRLFRSLLLLDPGVLPRASCSIIHQRHPSLEKVLRRKSKWSSVEEMISKFETREPFSRWPKDVLRNYCAFALNENHELQCTPQVEHTLYHSSLQTSSDIFSLLEQSKFIKDMSVHIVRSPLPFITGEFETSPTEPDLVKWFPKGLDTEIPNVKHFFPMDQPQLTIDIVNKMVKEHLRSHL